MHVVILPGALIVAQARPYGSRVRAAAARGGRDTATRARVLALWGVLVVVSLGLVGTLLGSGLTS